eukprot:149348-Prorocentrum_minimum.AAC.1
MQLPEELWQRVLYPQPARTLLRARAVCRQVTARVPEIPVNYLDGSTQVFCHCAYRCRPVLLKGLPPNIVSARVVDTRGRWHELVDDLLEGAPLALHWGSVGTMRCFGEGHGRCCAFAPDGRILVTGCVDGTAHVWDTSDWSCLRTLTGHTH